MCIRDRRWLDWGQAYSHVYAAAGYGVGLMVLTGLSSVYLFAPRLHWRRRLAPGGLTPKRWARRLVLGSLLCYAVLFTAGVALSVLSNTLASRPSHVQAWPSVMGDVLLAVSFGIWHRGRYEALPVVGLLWALGLALAVAGVLAVLPSLGFTPQRGLLWLGIQLVLVLPLTQAAIRAWTRRDPNAMA